MMFVCAVRGLLLYEYFVKAQLGFVNTIRFHHFAQSSSSLFTFSSFSQKEPSSFSPLQKRLVLSASCLFSGAKNTNQFKLGKWQVTTPWGYALVLTDSRVQIAL
jgi:hypothetical protein